MNFHTKKNEMIVSKIICQLLRDFSQKFLSNLEAMMLRVYKEKKLTMFNLNGLEKGECNF